MNTAFKFIELRARGWSFDRIAKEINVSKPTLIKWSRTHSVEIENHRQLELDSVREGLRLDRQSRLRSLGAVLDKLEKKISETDLSDVSTERALMILKKPSIKWQKTES